MANEKNNLVDNDPPSINEQTPLEENFQEGLGWENEAQRRQEALQESIKESGQTFIAPEKEKTAEEQNLPEAPQTERLNEGQQQDAVNALQQQREQQQAQRSAQEEPAKGEGQTQTQEDETPEGGESMEADLANKIKGATPLSTIEILKALLDIFTGKSDWKKFQKKMEDNQIGACACCSSCCCSLTSCLGPIIIIIFAVLLLQGLF